MWWLTSTKGENANINASDGGVRLGNRETLSRTQDSMIALTDEDFEKKNSESLLREAI